eukprot:PITA_09827
MVDEVASLHKNEAWDLVELPVGRKPIGSKWVFKKKANAEGKVEKYKTRLVAKGYSQVPGIDFGDIFSLVSNVTSIRLLLYVVVAFDFEVEQMDVKTTFLHEDREEEIYMKQSEGFTVKGKKELGRPGLYRVLDIGGFVEANWAGDLHRRRSTSGYLFNLFGGVVNWMSKKQSVVALSTTKA